MATMARDGRAVGGWLLVAALSFVLLPWYFLADQSVLQSLPGVWGAADGASGAVQAAIHGRPWLWIVPIALALSSACSACSARASRSASPASVSAARSRCSRS